MKIRQATWSLLLLLICVSGGICLFVNREQFEWPPIKPTYTLFVPGTTPSFTPYPDIGFEGITLVNTGCFDWSSQILTDIDHTELLRVLGRNRNGTWLMVRWPKFTAACWVESRLVKPSNFSLEELPVISAIFPPVSTPVSLTFTPTSTKVVVITNPPQNSDPTVQSPVNTPVPNTPVPTNCTNPQGKIIPCPQN